MIQWILATTFLQEACIMKKIGWSIVATVSIFIVAMFIIVPIISDMGYGSAEGSYHVVTYALLLSLIFTVIHSTMMIIEEINKNKGKFT